jgi:hypothetical protein
LDSGEFQCRHLADPQGPRRVGVGEPGPDAQGDGLAFGPGQAPHEGEDLAHAPLVVDPSGDLVRRVDRLGDDRYPADQRQPAAVRTPLGARVVARHRQQPGQRRPGHDPDVRAPAPRGQEGRLGQVLGRLPRSRQAETVVDDRLHVSVEEPGERHPITLDHPAVQVGVGRFRLGGRTRILPPPGNVLRAAGAGRLSGGERAPEGRADAISAGAGR